MDITVKIDIPHKERDFFVRMPRNLKKWAADAARGLEDWGELTVVIETNSGSVGGVRIDIAPNKRDDSFHFIVDKETLEEIISALQLAKDNIIV